MAPPETRDSSIAVSDKHRISALARLPSAARACFVLAHSAGAGMRHPFMETISARLGEVGIATLRYQFPYMEMGSRRPDPPALCHATVRAAVDEAARLLPGTPLIAGGRSFGGRMTSQAQAKAPLSGVRGLVFLGFPLHPARQPSDQRAAHLFDVTLPMLFLQGTRDDLADLGLLLPLIERLGSRATAKVIEGANHSFEVPARSGRKATDVMEELVQTVSDWVGMLLLQKP